MKLFCLPYAGGSAQAIYSCWIDKLEPQVNLNIVELKGRGGRYSEGSYKNISEAVDDIINYMVESNINEDYCIFGHSMGALLAYEVCKKIEQLNLNEPKHLFLSGHAAPHIKNKYEINHTLDDETFIREINNLGGIPYKLTKDYAALMFFVRIIKEDFRMINQYKYKKGNAIKCGISVFFGSNELINLNDVFMWESYTEEKISFYRVDGNHFFIHNLKDLIINLIKEIIKKF